MNLSDITKINFGSAGISAVYNGGIKLWPKGSELSNKVMKFTIVSGNTWDHMALIAYTADNKLIKPVKKDATGWTYDEEVAYIKCEGYEYQSGKNILTFEGFPKAVKLKAGKNMFYNNSKCTNISTANMDTSECTDINNMFNGCSSLTSLDLSNFNTSKVTDMGGMFNGCSGLTSLDLSNWNTSKVDFMNHMFYGCSGLTSLDVSHFDTLDVYTVQSMFASCRSLTSLDLSNWNISFINIMDWMFSNCISLATLDLSNWDTSRVTSMKSMFNNCTSLKTVKMTNCSQDTKDKIRAALDEAGLTSTVITE